MKFLSGALIILASSAAMASWDTTMNWPSINGLAINNACATPTTFKSLAPVKVCTATKVVRQATENYAGERGQVTRILKDGEQARRDEWVDNVTVCDTYGMQALEVSRTYTQTECAYYMPAGEVVEPCQQFVSKQVVAGLDYSVEEITMHGDVTEQKFVKFSIPACK